MMNVFNTGVSLQEIQRRAEIDAVIASHPGLAVQAAQRVTAARERVTACERALTEATTLEERDVRRAELKAARIHLGRVQGIPAAEDTGMRFTGAAVAFVGGADPTQSDWFQQQVEQQERQIPKGPTLVQQMQVNPPAGLPPGAVFIGDNWVRDWGQR